MGNTGLPYNPNAPQEVIDEVKAFRASNKKISFFQMFKEIGKMDNANTCYKVYVLAKVYLGYKKFTNWMYNSMQMEAQLAKSRLLKQVFIYLFTKSWT